MAGCWAICITPVTASVANHSRMIGPKARPTVAVPMRCTANRPTSTATDSGTTQAWSAGSTTCSPSIAPSTETAGVMTLSP